MGCITLFAISICTSQVHAGETKYSLSAQENLARTPIQADKPKITFNMVKKSVEDIPQHIEKPQVNLLNGSQNTLIIKETVSVPTYDSEVPVVQAPTPTNQSDRLAKAKKSILSLFNNDKIVTTVPPIEKPNIIPVQSNIVRTESVVLDKPKVSFINISDAQAKEKETNKIELINQNKKTDEGLVAKSKNVFASVAKSNKKIDKEKEIQLKITEPLPETEKVLATQKSEKTLSTPVKERSKNNVEEPRYIPLPNNQYTYIEPKNVVVEQKEGVEQKDGVGSFVRKTKQMLWPFKTERNEPKTSAKIIQRPNIVVNNQSPKIDQPTLAYSQPIDQKMVVKPTTQTDKNNFSALNKSETKDRQTAIQNFPVLAKLEAKEKNKLSLANIKSKVDDLVKPKSSEDFNKVKLHELSGFNYTPVQVQSLPAITSQAKSSKSTRETTVETKQTLDLYEAVRIAVSRHPEIAQSISNLASQNASVDVAKAGYFPQLSAGVSTGDFTSSQRGRQLLNLNATQMLYDFGKVKSSVGTQEAKLLANQSQVLVSIDQIASEVASAIVNIKRYEEVSRIAREQVKGISRVREIANLRAQAGISSQADPVQAQSYLEAAQSNLIVQETQLSLYKQKLRTLMGSDISKYEWIIPESLITDANIYSDPKFNEIPKMMLAKAQVNVAESEKKQTQLSRYPTLNVKGSLSQALNGINPSTNKDNGTDSSIMIEATSNFYQGGAVASQTRAASYAEEAAKARVNTIYLETLDEIRLAQEQVEQKKRQMSVLVAQQATSVRTKELYQEQYKLGTRTAVDLLNAEQAIHSANSQIESARYDIYENLVKYIAAAGKAREVYQLNNLTIQGVELKP